MGPHCTVLGQAVAGGQVLHAVLGQAGAGRIITPCSSNLLCLNKAVTEWIKRKNVDILLQGATISRPTSPPCSLEQAEAGSQILWAVFGQAEAVSLRVLRQPSAPPSTHLFGALIIQLFILLFTDILLILHIQLYFLHFCNSNRIKLFSMWGTAQ